MSAVGRRRAAAASANNTKARGTPRAKAKPSRLYHMTVQHPNWRTQIILTALSVDLSRDGGLHPEVDDPDSVANRGL